MIYSKTKNYLYFCNPKTATVSTEDFLLDNDETSNRRIINIDGKEHYFKDHTIAKVVYDELGKENFEKIKTFSIVRNPLSKLVSAYFFYKNGDPITRTNTNQWPTRFKILFARLLPIDLWVLIYPYRSNRYHLCDGDRIIVNYIGIFEALNQDLLDICNDILHIGIDPSEKALQHKNKSKHKDFTSYFKNKYIFNLVKKKVADDMLFYNYCKDNHLKDLQNKSYK